MKLTKRLECGWLQKLRLDGSCEVLVTVYE